MQSAGLGGERRLPNAGFPHWFNEPDDHDVGDSHAYSFTERKRIRKDFGKLAEKMERLAYWQSKPTLTVNSCR